MVIKWNKFLKLGFFFSIILILIAIFGPLFAPFSVTEGKAIEYYTTASGRKMMDIAPFPPSARHLFGTDKYGYDILSLLLYGAKYTIFTCIGVAFMRVAIGGLFGMFAGLKGNEGKGAILNLSILGSFPAAILLYFVMIGINMNSSLSAFMLVVVQGSLMVLLGIPGVYQVTKDKTIVLKKSLFVLASQSLGGNSLHLLIKHIYPLQKGNFIILIVNEMISTLHLIGQLGVFSLFLGGTIIQSNPTLYFSRSHEWSGLIAQSRSYLMYSQWIVLAPLLCYIFLIFSFYLLSKGLEIRRQEVLRKTSYIK